MCMWSNVWLNCLYPTLEVKRRRHKIEVNELHKNRSNEEIDIKSLCLKILFISFCYFMNIEYGHNYVPKWLLLCDGLKCNSYDQKLGNSIPFYVFLTLLGRRGKDACMFDSTSCRKICQLPGSCDNQHPGIISMILIISKILKIHDPDNLQDPRLTSIFCQAVVMTR